MTFSTIVVRGLLRRPEATLLVQKMQNGELQPGEPSGRGGGKVEGTRQP